MKGGLEADFHRAFPGGFRLEIAELALAPDRGVTVLFGRSGSGKSTVLRCIAGLDRPDGGTIRFGEQVWFDSAGGTFLPASRRRVGYVPQSYALFPHLTVEKNVSYGLAGQPPRQRAARVHEVLTWLGLQDLAQRRPGELSGGQQQRAALARAIVIRPNLLLLDEPLAALDAPLRVRLRTELRRQLLEAAIPTLLVTHDRAEALTMGDHVVVVHGGKVLQHGRVDQVFNQPSGLAAAAALGVETVQPGKIVESSGGLVVVQAGNARLNALETDRDNCNTAVYVCIRAEDVILMKTVVTQSSARNVLPAIVRSLTPEGVTVRIGLDCGFPLVAILTRQACADLDVKENDRLVALVKAPHVQLIPRLE